MKFETTENADIWRIINFGTEPQSGFNESRVAMNAIKQLCRDKVMDANDSDAKKESQGIWSNGTVEMVMNMGKAQQNDGNTIIDSTFDQGVLLAIALKQYSSRTKDEIKFMTGPMTTDQAYIRIVEGGIAGGMFTIVKTELENSNSGFNSDVLSGNDNKPFGLNRIQ